MCKDEYGGQTESPVFFTARRDTAKGTALIVENGLYFLFGRSCNESFMTVNLLPVKGLLSGHIINSR